MVNYEELSKDVAGVALRLTERYVRNAQATEEDLQSDNPTEVDVLSEAIKEKRALYQKHKSDLVDGETQLDFYEAVDELLLKELLGIYCSIRMEVIPPSQEDIANAVVAELMAKRLKEEA